MALSIPENRALKAKIAIPSLPPFGRSVSAQLLEDGLQVISGALKPGAVRGTQAVRADGGLAGSNEVAEMEPVFVPFGPGPTPELEKFEQSRTLATQFTSDGTTGDILVDMGNAPFNGNIISAQVEVSETNPGTAALAVRTENGQSLFQGAGQTQGGLVDLEPDFVAVGLFADPLFVPDSRIPLLAGEGVSLVMRLAGTVAANHVRALVGVTLQGVGEDLSKQVLLRATVPPPSPSAAVAGSPTAAPVPGAAAPLTGIVSALVRFNEWRILGSQVPMFLASRSTRGFNLPAVPNLGGEWQINLKITGSTVRNLRTQEFLRNFHAVIISGTELTDAEPRQEAAMARRQFLTGPVSAFRALPGSAEVEFITDPGESLIFGSGGVPTRFVDEFGLRVRA